MRPANYPPPPPLCLLWWVQEKPCPLAFPQLEGAVPGQKNSCSLILAEIFVCTLCRRLAAGYNRRLLTADKASGISKSVSERGTRTGTATLACSYFCDQQVG